MEVQWKSHQFLQTIFGTKDFLKLIAKKIGYIIPVTNVSKRKRKNQKSVVLFLLQVRFMLGGVRKPNGKI